MNKAIFLDRDGVINVERGYTHRLEDFVILPDLIEVLQIFQKKGYLLIVISNQSGIAKNLYKQEDVEVLHTYMVEELKKKTRSHFLKSIIVFIIRMLVVVFAVNRIHYL